MTRRETPFERDLREWLNDPEFRAGFERMSEILSKSARQLAEHARRRHSLLDINTAHPECPDCTCPPPVTEDPQ